MVIKCKVMLFWSFQAGIGNEVQKNPDRIWFTGNITPTDFANSRRSIISGKDTKSTIYMRKQLMLRGMVCMFLIVLTLGTVTAATGNSLENNAITKQCNSRTPGYTRRCGSLTIQSRHNVLMSR